MNDLEAIKRSILNRLNENIRATRDINYKNTKLNQVPLSDNASGDAYIQKMQDRINNIATQEKEIGSENSNIKSVGRIRDLLASKRQETENVVFKPAWQAGRNSVSSITRVAVGHRQSVPQLKNGKLPPLSSSKDSSNQSDSVHPFPEKKHIPIKMTVLPKTIMKKSKNQTIEASPILSRNNSSLSNISEDKSMVSRAESESEKQSSDNEKEEIQVKSKSWFTSKGPVIKSENDSINPKIVDKKESIIISKQPKSNSKEKITQDLVTEQPVADKTGSIIADKNIISKQPKSKSKEKILEDPVTEHPETPFETAKCQICKRPFNVDRLSKHEAICKKSKKAKKTRGNFDSSKMRVLGTELEDFVTKAPKSNPKKSKISSETPKNSNWRKKHEELIQALRQAKKIQAHIDKGGKASDIPVLVSQNDGKPCPHCSRKFSDTSFERHEKICGNLKNFGNSKK